MQSEIRGVMAAIRNSQMLRLLLIGFLVLLLLIPAAMIGGLVSGRRATREGAVEEGTAQWGKRQGVTRPALVIPYVQRRVQLGKKGDRPGRGQNPPPTPL